MTTPRYLFAIALSLTLSHAADKGSPYALKTSSGFYLSAYQGGGRTAKDAIHTVSRKVGSNEIFLIDINNHLFTFKTSAGFYLTAEGAGETGIATDRKVVAEWEQFTIVWVNRGKRTGAIKTVSGTFINAVNNGGIAGPGAISLTREMGESSIFTFVRIDDMPGPPQVQSELEPPTGRNLTRVIYGNAAGVLEESHSGFWSTATNNFSVSFVEVNRDDWSVYLEELQNGVRSGMTVQIDVFQKRVIRRTPQGAVNYVWAISNAFSRTPQDVQAMNQRRAAQQAAEAQRQLQLMLQQQQQAEQRAREEQEQARLAAEQQRVQREAHQRAQQEAEQQARARAAEAEARARQDAANRAQSAKWQAPNFQPLKVCVKTGTESGAGSRGSYIKVKLTIKNKTGQTEIAEGWLSKNDLSNDAYSCEQLGGYRYDMNLDPTITSFRIENHGYSGVGDSWLCEFIGVNFDTTNLTRQRVTLNKWINPGAWVEQDN